MEKNKSRRLGGMNRNKALLCALLILFCAGELTGVFIWCNTDIELPDSLYIISGSFFDSRAKSTFIQTVINSFSGGFILLFMCMLLGMGAVFQPIAAAVLFFRGLGTGVTLAEINSVYGMKGFALSLIMIIPYTAASAVIIAVGARESIFMSTDILKRVSGSDRNVKAPDIRLYFTKFIILTSVLAAASLADSLITFFFAGLWTRLRGL